MRKPASDVAGIEEVNAKQDKLTITPADDSKVVHTSDTSNWQKQAMFNPGDYKIDSTSPTTDFATLLRSKYDKGGIVYIRENNGPSYAPFVDAVVICEGDSWWYAYGVTIDGYFAHRRIRESDDTGWVINADDSKVAHLSGANNFDTVPTVNNNPLLLASSLPSDLARTGQAQTFTQPQTFSIAPTITDASTDKGDNQAATMADLKSVENSAWRQLNIPEKDYLDSAIVLYKPDPINKRVFISITGSLKQSDWLKNVSISILDLSEICTVADGVTLDIVGYDTLARSDNASYGVTGIQLTASGNKFTYNGWYLVQSSSGLDWQLQGEDFSSLSTTGTFLALPVTKFADGII